jgi:hypothetical protein
MKKLLLIILLLFSCGYYQKDLKIYQYDLQDVKNDTWWVVSDVWYSTWNDSIHIQNRVALRIHKTNIEYYKTIFIKEREKLIEEHKKIIKEKY